LAEFAAFTSKTGIRAVNFVYNSPTEAAAAAS